MLNLLNRIIVSAVLFVLLLLFVAVAVTPQGVAAFFSEQLGRVQVDVISVDHLIIAVVCLLLAALCGLLLSLQLRGRSSETVALSGSGSTELAADSVIQRVRQDVEAIEQVRHAVPRIVRSGKSVDVALEVRTDPDVDVPAKASEVEQVARDSLSRLGLKAGRLRTRIIVGKGPGAPAAPAAN
jgi:hypothetical protein